MLAFDAMDEFPEDAPISPVVWKRTDHRFVRIAVEQAGPDSPPPPAEFLLELS